ncbi:hypothetical protein GGR54DRAFT_583948 [Hypoxylon sp. NC1633]|nr:hypothetical protein GGR54DRAFT_583948 [Hypoxylon sp. NC1633]
MRSVDMLCLVSHLIGSPTYYNLYLLLLFLGLELGMRIEGVRAKVLVYVYVNLWTTLSGLYTEVENRRKRGQERIL